MTPHDAHHIPWKELVVPQIFNFSLFLGLLIYLVRKPLQAHFAGKRVVFEEHRKKAEEAKVQAERQNFEVRMQLKKLEEGANKDLDSAKKESASLKEKLVSEAKEQAARLEEEAKRMAEFERSRAINMLKIELANNAAAQAEQLLNKEVNSNTQEKLSAEFLGKIQAARP